MEKGSVFKILGNISGKFFNVHQSWQEEPGWMKRQYEMEVSYQSGDIDTPIKGAMKGLLNGGIEYTKANPIDAAIMAKDFAARAGITEENARAFVSGFKETAIPK